MVVMSVIVHGELPWHLRPKQVGSFPAQRRDFKDPDATCLEIGLVNNMPDSALEQTERQFLSRIEAASGAMRVRLRLYALPGIPRSDRGKTHISRFYSGFDDLHNASLDALIITGTEPRAADLVDEPYWRDLVEVFDWAERNTVSTFLSCLAAHAAVLHVDGIRRHALSERSFGVFDHIAMANHPLARGLPSSLSIPHSRWNEVRGDALASCGYQILAESAAAGIGLFAKQRRSLFLLSQGHPEYEVVTLFKEYRRDVGRFLKRERETYPALPCGYFDAEATEVFAAFRQRALSDRDESLLEAFPHELARGRLKNTWRSSAICMFRNWLLYVADKKASLRTRMLSMGAKDRIPDLHPVAATPPA
jgi:homoserine O-succinyltransferase